MTTFLCSLVFVLAAAACTERLTRAPRAVTSVPPGMVALASWAGLLAFREPTALRALYAFALIDLALLVIATVAVVRLLGGFEHASPQGHDGDDGMGDEPAPQPLPPTAGCSARPSRRPGRPTRRSGPRPARRPATTRR